MDDTTDTVNRHLVSTRGDQILILRPPTAPMSKAEALVFAAWIVALADDDEFFPSILELVQGS